MTACPTCGQHYDPLADPPPAPSSSDDRKRRALIAGAMAVLETKRRDRQTRAANASRTTRSEGETE